MSSDKKAPAKPNTNDDVFKKVHISEKKNIYRQLLSEKNIMLAMGSGDCLFHLTPLKLEGDKFIDCKYTTEESTTDATQEVIVNFAVGDQRYFLISYMTIDGAMARIDLSADLYILQRRKSARLRIPDNYSATMTFLYYNDMKVFFDGKIMDFSSGGCRVKIKTDSPEVKIGDRLKATIGLGSRRSFNIQGEARHIVTETVGGKVYQIFGVQFGPMDKALETKLITVFMDLQREIFLNFKI